VAGDISAGAVNVLFANPVVLQPGGYYAVLTLYSNAGQGTIRVQDDLTIAQPSLTSLIYIPGDQVFTNGNAMSVRLMTEGTNRVADAVRNSVVSLFPNPSTGRIQVELGMDGMFQADLYDAAGSLVRSFVLGRTSTIDLSDLAKGVYTLQLNSSAGRNQQRVVLH